MDIMDKWAKSWENVFYTIFRVLAGALFFTHGYAKLGPDFTLMSKMGIAGTVEIIVAILLVLGLFVRWASFFGAGQMLIAYFISHAPKNLWNISVNRGEVALLFFAIFCATFVMGNGKWSLHHLLFKNKKR